VKHLISAAAISLASVAAHAETYELTMASSHPTVLPWVGQLSTLVVAETNNRLEAMGSEDRVNGQKPTVDRFMASRIHWKLSATV
jgi:hypothetical protein